MRFVMHLNREPFEQLLIGEKTVELRLNDEKRSALRIGDTIRFIHSENEQKSFDGQIVNLFYAGSFAELFQTVSPTVCGFGTDSAEDSVEKMHRYYSTEEEKHYGVVGIEVRILGG